MCLNGSEKKRNRRSARRIGEAWLDEEKEKKMSCMRICMNDSEKFLEAGEGQNNNMLVAGS